MANYTYSIFDADPNSSSGCDHEDIEIEIEIEANSEEEAVDTVRDELESAAAGLSVADGYRVGQRLYALVWDANGTVVVRLEHELTAEDLSAAKADVTSWETVATYVATYPDGDDDGACDVEVQIGEAGCLWYLRTTDDAGGSDDCDDTAYQTREAAAEAAEAFAAANDEAPDDDDATAYVARLRDEAIGETDPDGEYCVYWSTALEDSGPRERYATAEQAVAAAEKADEELRQKHWRNLLCGFEARVLADGEWVQLDAVRD